MKPADSFRENAANCAQLSENATEKPAIMRYRRVEKAWLILAINQDLLESESPNNESLAIVWDDAAKAT